MVIAGVQHGNDVFGQKPAIGGKWRQQLGMIGLDWARSEIALGRGGPPDHVHYRLGRLVIVIDGRLLPGKSAGLTHIPD